MTRVGIDAHVLTGKFQGSRTYLLNLLRHLGRIDAVNTYLVYSFDPAVTRALLPFPNFEHLRLAVRAAVPRLLFYWPWEIARRRLDLLLTQYIAPLAYPARQIVVVHDLLVESHPHYFTPLFVLAFRLLVRLSARRARAVLAVSDTTRREIVARYRVPSERLHLVPGGIEPADVQADRDPTLSPAPYVLCVGRLEPRKNVATLLRAFPLMRTPGVRLVVVGREDFRASDVAAMLRAMQSDAPHGGLTWRQDVPDGALPALYRHAAVFAFPSFAEGFGLPVLEALVYDTPVVASDHPALMEVGGPGTRHFAADAPDAAAQLAALLDEAIAQGPLGSAAARAAHLAAYRWDNSARVLLAVINETPVSGARGGASAGA